MDTTSKTFALALILIMAISSVGLIVHRVAAADNSGPTIFSASPISASRLQTISIKGSGFGDVQPQTVSLGDGSVDTIDGGLTPSIQIRDESFDNNWAAGCSVTATGNENLIGVILVSWTDTQIVLGGFGSMLSTSGQGSYNLMPGDPIQILINVAGSVATYTTAVLGSQETTNSTNNGSAPIISSVSPITAVPRQTIYIYGSGFGNVQPQTLSLGDGSVDTIDGGSTSTPSIQIRDDSFNSGWTAGCSVTATGNENLIGIFLVSWTNTEIVLGGFGSMVSASGQGMFFLMPGDPIQILVKASGSVASYETAVTLGSGSSSNSSTTSVPALPTPELSVSCQSTATFSSFTVEINGSLTYNGSGIPAAPVILYYSIDGGSSWQGLTFVNTDSDGGFLAEWLPSVTGNFLINATYTGNSAYSSASTIVNLDVVPFSSQSAQDIFSVASNSTVSDFTFNSTSRELSFTVSGPSGTKGYANVFIAKSLVNSASDVAAFFDGNPMNYTVTSTDNAWILHFTYHHSTHHITVDLNNTGTAALSIAPLLEGAICGVIISLSVMTVLILATKRHENFAEK